MAQFEGNLPLLRPFVSEPGATLYTDEDARRFLDNLREEIAAEKSAAEAQISLKGGSEFAADTKESTTRGKRRKGKNNAHKR